MLKQLIEYCLANRFIVVAATALVALAGVRSASKLPVDAVPDMTNTQVTVITDAGALCPVEVEQYITYPVEASMGGLPNISQVRSVSKFGISVVTVVFREGTDIYRARQLVAERLPSIASKIPSGYGPPELGPLTTALGEILQFEIRGEGYTDMQLRTLLEWDIAPKLREVPGVTDINTHGGSYKTFEVRPDPDLLASNHLTLADIYRRLAENNGSTGGGYVVHHDEQRFIRGEALLRDCEDIRRVILRRTDEDSPVRVADVAEVVIAPMTRQGSVTRDGRGEAVTGLVMMLIGENSRRVVARVKQRIEQICDTLPEGVSLEIIYDRSFLISRTLHTVVKNLVEGGVLVILVLLLMLGSLRAGLIVAIAIPLSMLIAANLMFATGISASLMSLGAIDFGLIVDSSVIMIENCMHRLSHNREGRPRISVIRDACIEVRKPTMFGELIISVVYLPVLMLQGTEGKLFRPMALTVLFALFGSLILSMTLMPTLAAIALPGKLPEHDVWFIRLVKRVYSPLVHWTIKHPVMTTVMAIAMLVACIPLAARLGAEFMPRLEEGDLLIEVNRLPSATVEGAETVGTQIEKIILDFPEVKTVFCKTGRPEIANDVMGVNQTDVWVILRDRHEWRPGLTREGLIAEMEQRLTREIAGVILSFTQPIEMRVDELVAGVKSDVAVLLYGDSLEVLATKSKQIESILRGIDGAADVKADYQANLQTLSIRPRRDDLLRYGIDVADVMDVVQSLGGRHAGIIMEGRARFPIMVRLPAAWRTDPDRLAQIPVKEIGGRPLPLAAVADLTLEETPPTVEHERARRRTYIAANVRGRDVASFVADAQRAIARHVPLPAGYEIQWGGDFQNLQSASRRLLLITPIVLLLIFLLLHTTFRSVSLALLIFLAVPMATSGGIFALALRGMPFSISAGVGFIALFGVAVLNGLVWVSAAEHARLSGMAIRHVAEMTAIARLRPVLMTALVASLGFVPMAISHGDGAELQRPLATVVIGGLVTSTLLTGLVLPAIYTWFAPRHAVE